MQRYVGGNAQFDFSEASRKERERERGKKIGRDGIVGLELFELFAVYGSFVMGGATMRALGRSLGLAFADLWDL